MRSLSFSIRYLFGKKSTNAINIISGVSVFGISIGTAALILVMSVLNGFEDLIISLINSFNADVKITVHEGKTFRPDDQIYQKLVAIPNVRSVSPYLEETSLLEYKSVKDFATLKGVDSNYHAVGAVSQKMDEGRFQLQSAAGYQAVVGLGIRNKLAISIDDDFARLTAYMPDPNGSTFQPFKKRMLIPVGVFSVQQEYDNKYVFVDIDFLQDLVHKINQITGYEIQLKDYKAKDRTIASIQSIVGKEFKVQDRNQQDAAFYKLMKIEKWVSYAILSFVLVLVAFNIVGALWMIVLEKKKDIMVLKTMGMKDNSVRMIFMQTGLWITGVGILAGFILAMVMYMLQLRFGIVPIPEGFLVDRYPINLRWTDFMVVGITVAAIGFVASVLPSRKAAELRESIRYE